MEEEVIRDALCAAALLRAEPLIRPDRVYLLGHSMGGMLAPRIDAEGGAFRRAHLLGGHPRTLDALILEQNEASLAAMPPEQRAAAAPLFRPCGSSSPPSPAWRRRTPSTPTFWGTSGRGTLRRS